MCIVDAITVHQHRTISLPHGWHQWNNNRNQISIMHTLTPSSEMRVILITIAKKRTTMARWFICSLVRSYNVHYPTSINFVSFLRMSLYASFMVKTHRIHFSLEYHMNKMNYTTIHDTNQTREKKCVTYTDKRQNFSNQSNAERNCFLNWNERRWREKNIHTRAHSHTELFSSFAYYRH